MADATDIHKRQRFILDSSMALSWCFPDEKSALALPLIDSLSSGAVAVPALWYLEISNALVTGERQGRLTRIQISEAFDMLSRLPLRVDDRSGFGFAAEVLALARKYTLSSYDATYLELALRLSLPLATLDRSLRRAAKKAGVAIAR